MVAVVEPERIGEVEELCERWELACTVIGEVTETGELRCFFDGEAVGEIPARFLTDEAPRYELETEPREPAAPVEVARRAGRAVPPPRVARLAQHPQPPPRLRALRPPRRVAHRSPSRARRRGAAAAPVHARARGFAGRPGPRSGARSAHGRDERGARVGAQRRLRGRHAARDHELPELRQSREAGRRLGADRGDRGHGARLRGARRSRRLRERVALQRDRRTRHRSHTRGRLRRDDRGRAEDSLPLAGGRRRAARRGRAGRARRLRVPGALPRRRRRVPATARPRRRGGIDPVPGRERRGADERARRLRRRPRGRAGRAGDLVGDRRGDRSRPTTR